MRFVSAQCILNVSILHWYYHYPLGHWARGGIAPQEILEWGKTARCDWRFHRQSRGEWMMLLNIPWKLKWNCEHCSSHFAEAVSESLLCLSQKFLGCLKFIHFSGMSNKIPHLIVDMVSWLVALFNSGGNYQGGDDS
jgi:hypothetical protein